MKDYHVLAGIYGLICILMLSVVLLDEFWKGDVLQFVFDSVKYIFAIAVLFVIRMFMREKMFNPMWEKIADPYKDDEEKKRVRINYHSFIYFGNKLYERLVTSELSKSA